MGASNAPPIAALALGAAALDRPGEWGKGGQGGRGGRRARGAHLGALVDEQLDRSEVADAARWSAGERV